MRPRLKAAENASLDALREPEKPASMRPRLKAAENLPFVVNPSVTIRHSFNEAAA